MIRRMRLVNDEEIDRMRDQQMLNYEPNIRAANKLDDEIRSLLNDEVDGTAEEVVRALRSKQARLKMLLGAAKEAGAPPAPPAPPPAPAPPAPAHDLIADMTLISSVQKGNREKALAALQMMRENDVVFDRNKRLIVKGEAVEGTNGQELINAMFSPTLKNMPSHSKTFTSALRDINFPDTYVVNPMFKREINPPSSTFTIKSSPHRPSQSGKGYAAHASLLLSHAKRKRPAKRPAKRPIKRLTKRSEYVMRLYP